MDLFPDSENTKEGMSRVMPLFKMSHSPVLTVPSLPAPSYDEWVKKEKDFPFPFKPGVKLTKPLSCDSYVVQHWP